MKKGQEQIVKFLFDSKGFMTGEEVVAPLVRCKDCKHYVEERNTMQWIPCGERLPEDLEEVNVTWVIHDPEPYYNFAKDKPFTATAVYYKEKWYWYSSTCADFLAEYGQNRYEEIDDGIEIIAWMPLPKPWKGELE